METSGTALVLEGGGMRGIFTIGVLDAFMRHGLHFPYVVGVSAGACNGCSYVSQQPGRARFSNVEMMRQYDDYISFKNLFTQGNIFNVELLYDRLPNELYPFDYPTFFSSEKEYEMVVTNCLTGKAEYKSERKSPERTMDIILASSTLPYVGKMVTFDESKYLDGGIVDSIPLRHALEKGYDKAVVVLTRNEGYRKKLNHGFMLNVLQKTWRWIMYRKYPNLREALKNRGVVYNSQLDYIEQMEKEGRVLVIRPEKPIMVDRIEKNADRLQNLYEEGFRIAEKWISKYFPDKPVLAEVDVILSEGNKSK